MGASIGVAVAQAHFLGLLRSLGRNGKGRWTFYCEYVERGRFRWNTYLSCEASRFKNLAGAGLGIGEGEEGACRTMRVITQEHLPCLQPRVEIGVHPLPQTHCPAKMRDIRKREVSRTVCQGK